MHFKEELDISTIWWIFEPKVWLQLLQAAELEHIVLDKLFSLFSSWILNYIESCSYRLESLMPL